MKLVCDHGHSIDDRVLQRCCPVCGAPIQFIYDQPYQIDSTNRTMWRYSARLPKAAGAVVTLGEGGTPLVRSRLDLGCQAFWKNETRNPTGSQKDRALAMAIAAGAERGAKRVIMASTGSAGLACSAYAARANMQCFILCPGDTATERLISMWVLGATVLRVDGSFEELMEIIAMARKNWGYYETTTYRRANPYQAEAPKTIAYEIVEDLGEAPTVMIVPVGGGGTLSGIWRGFVDLHREGVIGTLPRMVAVQNVKFNSLALALAKNLYNEAEVEALGLDAKVSVVTGNLKHAVPPDVEDALRALRESNGEVVTVTDEEAMQAQLEMGRADGIFAEPSSSVGLVAVRKLAAAGKLSPADKVVAVVTGSGLREISTVLKYQQPDIPRIGVKDALELLRP